MGVLTHCNIRGGMGETSASIFHAIPISISPNHYDTFDRGYIGVARIFSGVHFFAKKLTTFFSRRPQRPSKSTSKSKPSSKNGPKYN